MGGHRREKGDERYDQKRWYEDELAAAIFACKVGGIGVDPIGLVRRLVTVLLGFPEGVRAAAGTTDGRARAASCWGGLDMTGGKKERRSEEGGRRGDGGSEGKKGDIRRLVARSVSKINSNLQRGSDSLCRRGR